MEHKENYDASYFDWQKNVGVFGGMANRFKFEDHTSESLVTMDFGCGGGFLISNTPAKKKIGFDVNPNALANARTLGVETYSDLKDVPDNSIDLIISNHALEHVPNPFETLSELKNKLTEKGKVVFVVPHEGTEFSYDEADINMHLYTWNQMTLGNLFKFAGYKIIQVDAIQHRWPENYMSLCKRFGWKNFHRICRFYAKWNNKYQIRIVASKN